MGAALIQEDGAPVLLTGAAGLIGQAVCDELQRIEVSVVATYFRRHPPSDGNGVKWVCADLREAGGLDGLGCLRAVIHLAAELPSGSGLDKSCAISNRLIDQNVIDATLGGHVPLVYASTTAFYGGTPPATGWSEDDAIAPASPYQDEKAWAEEYGMTRASQLGGSFTSLRINAPYGPGQRTRTVLQIFVERALAGGPLRYFGSGSRQQDFTYVSDAAQACVAALSAPSGIYNVSGGEPVTMRGLAERVAESAGLANDSVIAAGEPDPQEGRRVEFDLTRSAQLLRWTPCVTLDDGIRRCLQPRAKA